MGGAGQAMKRIPRIKFPQRHPNPSGLKLQTQEIHMSSDAKPSSFSGFASSSVALGGKASEQLKRMPISLEEIDAIMLGGCI